MSTPCAWAVLVAQLCLTLCNPMDCSLPGSSVLGDSPGKNTRVGCHALLQGIFPTQGSNPGLLHCKWFFINWATREASLCAYVSFFFLNPTVPYKKYDIISTFKLLHILLPSINIPSTLGTLLMFKNNLGFRLKESVGKYINNYHLLTGLW